MIDLATFLLGDPCPGCGASSGLCPACLGRACTAPAALPRVAGIDGLVAVGLHRGLLREAVTSAKYRGRRRCLAPIVDLLVDRIHGAGWGADGIVAIPASAARRHVQGVDHGQVLAQGVRRGLGLGRAPRLRRLDGRAQTGRTGADRRRDPPRFATSAATGRRLVLVDDVVTTGATLRSAAGGAAGRWRHGRLRGRRGRAPVRGSVRIVPWCRHESFGPDESPHIGLKPRRVVVEPTHVQYPEDPTDLRRTRFEVPLPVEVLDRLLRCQATRVDRVEAARRWVSDGAPPADHIADGILCRLAVEQRHEPAGLNRPVAGAR